MSTSRDPKFKSEKAQPAAALSRREFVAGAAAAAARGFVRRPGQRRSGGVLSPYGNGTIPAAIRSRTVPNVNGLTVHVLEAGFDTAARPAVLLLHGFPELAYSWRKVMLPLAAEGYHVIAPDQRGYGRTTGWDESYDADPARHFPLTHDPELALRRCTVSALRHREQCRSPAPRTH